MNKPGKLLEDSVQPLPMSGCRHTSASFRIPGHATFVIWSWFPREWRFDALQQMKHTQNRRRS
jgi:hypothetical protein